jgi:ubiquinone/menaquinone biosynthesis methyltransferase
MESSFTQQEPATIQHLFAQIADRYDLANTLLSLGFDSWWRAYVSARIVKWAPHDVLDLATGSGVLAEAIIKRIPAARVVGADFCAPMLAVASRRGIRELVVADGLALPFIAERFDVVTIAFGLRNMASYEKADASWYSTFLFRVRLFWPSTAFIFIIFCRYLQVGLPANPRPIGISAKA